MSGHDQCKVVILQAEAAAAAGESSFRSFMIAVQRSASTIAILQQVIIISMCLILVQLSFISTNSVLLQYFSNTIARLLLPVDGAHAASCEEMGTAVSRVEAAAHKGLLQCIDTVMAEVCICSFVLILNELFDDVHLHSIFIHLSMTTILTKNKGID